MRRHLMKGHKDGLPQWLKDSVVCWYSPIRQGCTNEKMAANPVLRDLSGNGIDLECVNFSWNETSGIAPEGCLIADGRDDYGIARNFPSLTDFTIIWRFEWITYGAANVSLINTENASVGNATFMTGIVEVNNQVCSRGFLFNAGKYGSKSGTSVMTPSRYYDERHGWFDISHGNYVCPNEFNPLLIAKNRLSGGVNSNAKIFSVIIFDRTLTDKEIEYVKQNLID